MKRFALRVAALFSLPFDDQIKVMICLKGDENAAQACLKQNIWSDILATSAQHINKKKDMTNLKSQVYF